MSLVRLPDLFRVVTGPPVLLQTLWYSFLSGREEVAILGNPRGLWGSGLVNPVAVSVAAR